MGVFVGPRLFQDAPLLLSESVTSVACTYHSSNKDPPQQRYLLLQNSKRAQKKTERKQKQRQGSELALYWVVQYAQWVRHSEAVWQTRRWSQVFLDLHDITGRKAPKQQWCLKRKPKKKNCLWIYWLVATRGQHGLSILASGYCTAAKCQNCFASWATYTPLKIKVTSVDLPFLSVYKAV